MQLAAIFAADLHISDYIWSSHPSIVGDSFFAFQQVVELAVEFKCPLVLAGDVLELMRTGTPTSRTVSEVSRGIERLKRANVPLHYISGQHDLASPSWLESINTWAQDVNQRSFEINGRTWYGINYHETDLLEACLQHLPENLYGLVVHQRWREFGGGSNSHGSLTDIVEANPSLKAIVSGDLHQMTSQRIRGCYMISPGATHKRTIAEPNQHSVIALTMDGGVLPIRLRSRPVVSLTAKSEDGWNKLKVRIPGALARSTAVAIKAGIPPGVSTPLLIIEDQVHCDAVAAAKEAFSDSCYVMTKNSTLKKEAVENDFKSLLSGNVANDLDRKKQLQQRVEQWAIMECGGRTPTVDIICGLMDGSSIEQLRNNYLRGVACGDSERGSIT